MACQNNFPENCIDSTLVSEEFKKNKKTNVAHMHRNTHARQAKPSHIRSPQSIYGLGKQKWINAKFFNAVKLPLLHEPPKFYKTVVT